MGVNNREPQRYEEDHLDNGILKFSGLSDVLTLILSVNWGEASYSPQAGKNMSFLLKPL